MCSHEPGQRAFNVDANGSIPEIVHRMLVDSWPGRPDLTSEVGQTIALRPPRGSSIASLELTGGAGGAAVKETDRVPGGRELNVPARRSVALRITLADR